MLIGDGCCWSLLVYSSEGGNGGACWWSLLVYSMRVAGGRCLFVNALLLPLYYVSYAKPYAGNNG